MEYIYLKLILMSKRFIENTIWIAYYFQHIMLDAWEVCGTHMTYMYVYMYLFIECVWGYTYIPLSIFLTHSYWNCLPLLKAWWLFTFEWFMQHHKALTCYEIFWQVDCFKIILYLQLKTNNINCFTYLKPWNVWW